MERNSIEKIDKSVQEVCKIIVEEGKVLTASEYGIIYIVKRNKLGVIYSTLPRLTKIKLSKNALLHKENKKGEIKIINEQELLLPLICHKKSVGLLLLYSAKEKLFTEKELAFMRVFSSVAGIALEKTKLQAETQNALETRDRFLSLASHELRTPLTSIHGYIQMLHKRFSEKDTVESRWIKELYIESTRLTHLIKEFLDINRIKQEKS